MTIVAAVAAVIGASTSAVNYWRTHHGPLPNAIRRKLVARMDRLASELRYLRSDVDAIEEIFRQAKFPDGRTLRLGNGALLTRDQFRRYERLADQVFGHLKKIHKLALNVQGFAFDLPHIDQGGHINVAGEALERVEALIRSRDYSVDKAWSELKAIISELESMIAHLNAELGR